MKLKGKLLLKITGMIYIFLGLILVFAGFYIMANGMSVETMSPDMSTEQLSTMKYLGAGGMYIIVVGVVDCIAGFVGFLNADNQDYAKKCCMYGGILMGFSILDLIVLMVIADAITTFDLFVIIIPFIMAGIYLAGAVLNFKTPVTSGEE